MTDFRIDAQKLYDLKKKITQEMAKRACTYGSLEKFASIDYEFS